MSTLSDGNKNPHKPDNTGEWKMTECPICGDDVKKVADHIRREHE